MYKRKKQNAKFKLRIELIGMLLVVALMITLSVVLRLPDEKTKFANTINGAGGSLSSDHLFVESNFDSLYDKMNDEELTFVYYGATDVFESMSEMSTINTRAVLWDVEEILFIDGSKYYIDEEADDYEEDLELNATIKTIEDKLNASKGTNIFVGDEGISDIDLSLYPSIWVFQNGELVFNSTDFYDYDDEVMNLGWSAVADRAFYINLPNYDEPETDE